VSAPAASVMPLAIRQGGYAATTPSGRFSRLAFFFDNRDGVLKEIGDISLVVKSVRHPRAHLFLKGLSGGKVPRGRIVGRVGGNRHEGCRTGSDIQDEFQCRKRLVSDFLVIGFRRIDIFRTLKLQNSDSSNAHRPPLPAEIAVLCRQK
ncbi:MAG: hypothetical protein VX373_09345, partial [Pseudomonadota bacterium]|nr:hypothetical protein [Pseudomonadota bacterium]